MSAPETYTLSEVLEKLGLSPSGYYKMRSEGRWPFFPCRPKIGRSERFPKEPIDRYLAGEGITEPREATVPTDRAALVAYVREQTSR
jgi:predicted DNA-binding transcriptional regulator AlpA